MRRLAAILVTDVAGYTKLMEAAGFTPAGARRTTRSSNPRSRPAGAG